MTSSPSPRTQRRYGVSFSVANFLANSSETVGPVPEPALALLTIRGSLWALVGATLVGTARASTPRQQEPDDKGSGDAVRHVRSGAACHGRLQGDHPVGQGRARPVA